MGWPLVPALGVGGAVRQWPSWWDCQRHFPEPTGRRFSPRAERRSTMASRLRGHRLWRRAASLRAVLPKAILSKVRPEQRAGQTHRSAPSCVVAADTPRTCPVDSLLTCPAYVAYGLAARSGFERWRGGVANSHFLVGLSAPFPGADLS